MTDHALLSRVLACIDPSAAHVRLVRRNGQILLGLPSKREAANRALGLYQPQRSVARIMVKALHGLAGIGLQGCILPKLWINPESMALSPPLHGIDPETCGVLLGSPEHRVRRAVASYRQGGNWEVAKVSFGEDGARILNEEARALTKLAALAECIPKMLGLHCGDKVTILRMPYLTGQPVPPGDSNAAIRLLSQWIGKREPQPITGFPEWEPIRSALTGLPGGNEVLERLAVQTLLPVMCHGDFARWNLLRQNDGQLAVLDWEWGHAEGMPGLDLVHYFLQDERLVMRSEPTEAIRKTCLALGSPACRDYLERTGWSGGPLLPVIASLAYKQGAGHQENVEVLRSAILNVEF